MVNSRQKGKRGELELVHVLRRHGWLGARRGQQRSGVDQADVIGGPRKVHWECKLGRTVSLLGALQQAQEDAPEGELPVVALRRDRGAWVALLPLHALLELLWRWEATGLGAVPSKAGPPD